MSEGEKLISELNELKLEVAHKFDILHDSLGELDSIYRLGAPNDDTCFTLQKTVKSLGWAFFLDAQHTDRPSVPVHACMLENFVPITDKILKIQKKAKWSLLKPSEWRKAVVCACINSMCNVVEVIKSIQVLITRFNSEFSDLKLF